MFINIFSKNKNSNNNQNNNDNFMSDFAIKNNKNEIINNLKQKILEADSNTKLNKSSKEKNINDSQISKIKLLLQNNNNMNKLARKKSEENFTFKNKLNLVKDQINHSNSINTSYKFEKKFTYKLHGNNLVKSYSKSYSKKISNDSKKSQFHKTKSWLLNNLKNNDLLNENNFFERNLKKNNSIENIIDKNRIDRKNYDQFYKTLSINNIDKIVKIENKYFNQKSLFDSIIKINKGKKNWHNLL